MEQEILIRRVRILDALAELGDGLNAWYLTAPEVASAVGASPAKVRVDLAALEVADLVESNFKRPKGYRIRRRGDEVLRTIHLIVATYSAIQEQAEALVQGYVKGVMAV